MERDNNIVGILRDKDEADLDGVLKTTFGGYTKQSVQEYLSLIHKQQQAAKETFSKNLQTLFDEKEELRIKNETLQARLNKLSSEYDNLSCSLKDIVLDDSEYSAQNVLELKNKIVSLEEQVKVTNRENYSLERKIEQLNNEIDELKTKLEISNKEYAAQKEMLKSERIELKKQRDIVADLSNKLEEEKNEVKYLKGTISDGKFAELNAKIGQLSAQLSAQTEVNGKLNEEIIMKDKTIDSLNDEVSLLKEKTNNLMKTLQEYNIQNDKLLVANEALEYQLQEEYKKTIALINEKSGITIDRLIAQKNLTVAEAKIAALEVQLLKTNKAVEVKEEMNSMKSDVSSEVQDEE